MSVEQPTVDIENEFLAAFLDRLDAASIPHCILGGYGREIDVADSDIDLWVADGNQATAEELLRSTAAACDYTVFEPNVSPRLSDGEGKYDVVSESDPNVVVQVDLWTHVYWRSVPFLDNDVITETLVRDNRGLSVAAPGVEAADSMVGDVLHGRPLTDERRTRIAACLTDDEEVFERVLTGPFSADVVRRFAAAARDGQFDAAAELAPELRRDLVTRSVRGRPLGTLARGLRYLGSGLRDRLVGDHGVFVVVIGPDGSGKTTTGEALLDSEFADRVYEGTTYWYRDIPVLPTMGEIASKVGLASVSTSARDDGDDDTRVLEPLSTGRAMLYPIYYGINDAVGRILVWRGKTNGGSVMVVDRYFYEFELQRQYENCPNWLVRVLEYVVPDPDLLVFATAEPEIIRDRCDELPRAEIERQLDVCRSIADRKHSVAVETVDGVDDVVRRVQQALLDVEAGR